MKNIQVYSRASDQESCGWWRAIVKMIKVERTACKLASFLLYFCFSFQFVHLFVPIISDSFSTFQGDFHVVEYLGWETTYTEIVPSDRWVDHIFLVVTTCSARRISFAFLLLRLRPKSAEACITGASFFKFSLPVPQELQVSFSCFFDKNVILPGVLCG